MALKEHHVAYLNRTSRILSSRIGKNVSRDEVLGLLIDRAIQDEEMFDPEFPLEKALDPTRRGLLQTESVHRTTSFSPAELLQSLIGEASAHSES